MKDKVRVEGLSCIKLMEKKKIYPIWSIGKSWINNPFYRNRDKCGRFVPDPSARINSVHFHLGAMLPCSTPFCTSVKK